MRRRHLDESGLQKAVRQASRLAGIDKPVTCHTFRQREAALWSSFATRHLESGYDIRTVQQLLGHKACPEAHRRDVKTTMTPKRTHVLNRGPMAAGCAPAA